MRKVVIYNFRVICEVFSIGCLVMHGNLPAVNSALRKSYKADWIINQLSKIHVKFFPVPLENEDLKLDGQLPKMVEKQSGFLTQAEVGQLWQRAGDVVHRGSAKAVLSKEERPLRLDEVQTWRDKIIALLNRHTIVSPDEETLIHIVMNNNGTGEIGWNIMKRMGNTAPQ